MRNYGIKLAVYSAFFILSGCVSTVSHKNQPQGVTEGDPNGLYAITTHIPGISMFTGSTTALIAMESDGDGFKANSRPRAVGELLGGFPGFYVDIFGDKRVPGGAFLHWSAQIPVKNQITHGIFKTPRADLKTDFYSYDKPIELRFMDSERLFGLMNIAPANAKDFPKTDYLELVNQIDIVLKAQLFDPGAYEASETQNFLNNLIKKHNAFIGIIEPVDLVYNGQVVILVNSGTASACEPVVAGLQDSKRVTIIGEKTAGVMLLSTEFDVGDGWLLSVPTIDYLTIKGIRLDGRGVVPDIETSSEEAPQVAKELLLNTLCR